MKLATLLAAALVPIGLQASPIANTDDFANSDNSNATLVERGPGGCRMLADTNCRSGPGTQYRVIATAKKGVLYFFTCVKSGECITVGGSTNCGWDRLSFRDFESPCYVNGHYTDNQCTVDKLGKC